MGTCETSHRAEPYRISHRLLSDASPSRQHAERGVNHHGSTVKSCRSLSIPAPRAVGRSVRGIGHPRSVAYRRTALDRHLRFCTSQWVFRHSGCVSRIDHINTNGLGLDRGNNRSNGLGARALFVAHQRPQSSSASRFTAGASGFLNLSQSRERVWPFNYTAVCKQAAE
jgi:hypothetical protein